MTPASVPEQALVAPVSGKIIPLADVPDPVFSSGALGEGFGVVPSAGDVVAPAAGTVTMVAETGHAVGIATADGLEILLHLGVDTVELEGRPFRLTAAVGQTVQAGQRLGAMDLAAITAAGKDTTTIVAVTNSAQALAELRLTPGEAQAGAGVAAAVLKAASGDSAVADASAPAPDDGLTGFDATARDIIAGVGGAANIRSVIHCITRVRFYLKDEAQADDAAVTGTEGVIDVARAGGQYQVVIGATVDDVYEAIIKQLPHLAEGGGDAEQAGPAAPRPTTAIGWVKYGFSSLIGVITGSMIPVIGVLAASGILKGILALLTQFNVVDTGTSTYTFIDAMASSMFYFLPIIIGFTSARRLGADPIIVAIIGGVLTFPSVVSMADSSAEDYHVIARIGRTVFNSDFFRIPVSLPEGNAYAYSIFPIIVAAWLASKLEPWLKKWIPAVVRSIFAPLLEIFIVSTLVLVVFGPIVMTISGAIAQGVSWVLSLSYPVAGLLIGGFYQCLVIFGLHWAVIPIISQQIADPGYSPLNAIVSASMIAQGGGALALWVKAKSPRIKQLAGPATISALCGVTEPAMYGLNLKYGRVFITASIGGAVGGLLTGLFDVNMWGFTGAFVGFPSFVNPEGIDGSFTGFWIASVVTLAVSFLATYFFGFKESDFETERTVEKVRLGNREPVAR
ncbi:PTS system IIA component, Glc family /PTS system IIB component, Glc family /PTS system IIC component, Glc family [Actinomyces ruminicola]|uniref:PTS system IIA component, Glc family /PTS system IIB component, Glc family /PTS system IIC component, Glc family n=1 Tax=Actinomyces ruminicola TaxID=332524 RepID=A0A1G9ZFC3_9ACTO|nr:PTS glucose transporter subunit IIABC [Actinomyces ruminicola]SDN19797.1 PTS system IIA component, Glc family /PTS system IIB component, Glc family /PTS system IIC component, Glc family [Actinomyces ruminicola]